MLESMLLLRINGINSLWKQHEVKKTHTHTSLSLQAYTGYLLLLQLSHTQHGVRSGSLRARSTPCILLQLFSSLVQVYASPDALTAREGTPRAGLNTYQRTSFGSPRAVATGRDLVSNKQYAKEYQREGGCRGRERRLLCPH